MIQENPLLLAGNVVLKAEASSEYFSEVFSTADDDRPTVTRDHGSVSMDPVVTEKETLLRLSQLLKPDISSGPDDIHLSVMKALSNSLAEPLPIRFDISMIRSRLSRYWEYTPIIPVCRVGRRHLVSYFRPVNLTSVVVKLLESIIRAPILNYI